MFFDRPRRRFSRLAQARRVQLSVEMLENRLTPYGMSANAWPHPELITLSFVPDDTVVGSNANGNIYSNLQSTLDNHPNALVRANWRNEVLRAAQAWAQQTNLNFALVADNGASLGSGAYQQGDPEMGDIRIGGWHMGATAQLGQAYAPPPINNYSVAGDIQLNMSRNWNVGTTYDLYTVALHEIGHALGLYHANGTAGGSTAAVMWSTYQGTRTGPNPDDINGARNKYSADQARSSDAFDAAAPNDDFASATALDGWINPADLTAVVSDLDITTTADADYYSFYAPAETSGAVTITVQSLGLSLLSPQVTVYAADQTTVLGSASAPGEYGATLSVTLAGVNPWDQFYVVVDGVDSTAFGTGKYGLALNLGAAPMPGVAVPVTLTDNGNPLSSGGGQALLYNSEFRVNTTTGSDQNTLGDVGQAVAMDALGNYVVTWASYGQDGSGYGVYAQRYNAAGVPQGEEFRVNGTTSGSQNYPSVATDALGNFVVTWTSNGDVYARRYNALGAALGNEFRVNNSTAGSQDYSAIAMSALGDFVITWSSYGQDGSGYGVYARRYDAAGLAHGNAFRVNATTSGDQDYSSVAVDGSGDFVVTWTHVAPDYSGSDIYARRYNAAGAALGGEFLVNSNTADWQEYSSVAVDANGNAVVTWSSYGPDGSGYGVYARRYDAAGVALGGDFRVSTTTDGDQMYSAAGMDSNGSFIITWTDSAADGDFAGVYAQQYTAAGANLGTEFRVNTTTAGDQHYSALALNAAGRMVVVWSGNGPGDTDGVFAQQYLVNAGSGLSSMEAEAHEYGEIEYDHEHDSDGSHSQSGSATHFFGPADQVNGLIGTSQDRTRSWPTPESPPPRDDLVRSAAFADLDWWGTTEEEEEEDLASDLAAWRGGSDAGLAESGLDTGSAAPLPVE